MTETRFTPAPWDYIESNCSNLIHVETPCNHPREAGFSIATTKEGKKEERLANAYLISAAPEMYEIIEELTRHYIVNPVLPGNYPNGQAFGNALKARNTILDKAKNVLKKARGEE